MKGVKVLNENGKRISKGLGFLEGEPVSDLRELVKRSRKKYDKKVGFKYKTKDNGIVTKTYRDFDEDIDSLGTALISLGLKDKRIAIISENRYEWGVSYFATVNGTGVVVPLDKYLPKNEVLSLIQRGKVDAIFYSATFQDMMDEISKEDDTLKFYICIDTIETNEKITEDSRFYTLKDLLFKGKELLESGNRDFVDCELDKEKMSILLFTSGTTNMSKGVMLSHSNISANMTSIVKIIKILPNDVHLSLLPLHHTFENTIGLCFMVYNGVTIAYNQGIRYLSQNLNEFDVSILVAVPAILEAMYKKIQDTIDKSGKRKMFNMLISISEALRKVGIDVRRKLFKSVFDKIGPNLRLAVSGAAPMDPEVIKGFEKLGLFVLQGYGLTETSPVVSATSEFVTAPGTIGVPVSDVEVTIDSPDENGMGEILVKGKNVMLGYYEDENATKEAITEDGWFKTGDLGVIDENGILKITGRAKSMIVFTNGKKAFPEEFEMLLNSVTGIKDSFVWGNEAPDGDIQVCACIVLDREQLNQMFNGDFEQKDISTMLNKAIREINNNLPQYKIIRYFVTTEKELIKTTTLKIKRKEQSKLVQHYLNENHLDMRKASGNSID